MFGSVSGNDPREVCRFATSFDWTNLPTDSSLQEAYLAAMLSWDGKFATSQSGTTNYFLTRDHLDLSNDGNMRQRASYTAASKESLNIGMLALIADKVDLAWHWIDTATNADDGASLAADRLEKIITAYERWNSQCPGCGGFLPWIGTSNDYFNNPSTINQNIPALDNGQLAWSFIAASRALRNLGRIALADRIDSHIDLMKASAPILFLRPDGSCASGTTILNTAASVSASNVQTSGRLVDPFEGELMVMFLDLVALDENASRDGLWSNQINALENGNGYGPVTYSSTSGDITVQQGWGFSSHEMWKYMVLPYLDHDLVRRIFTNGERARALNSIAKSIPGMLGSCYDWTNTYHDNFGIPEIAKPYSAASDASLAVTPYGAYPLMLVDRGLGLAWHQLMLARSKMQAPLGSIESSKAFQTDEVPPKMSWDTKVTCDLAALGGLSSLLRDYISSIGKSSRFHTILDNLHNPFYQTLAGEDIAIPAPPASEQNANDWSTCRKVDISTISADFSSRSVPIGCSDCYLPVGDSLCVPISGEGTCGLTCEATSTSHHCPNGNCVGMVCQDPVQYKECTACYYPSDGSSETCVTMDGLGVCRPICESNPSSWHCPSGCMGQICRESQTLTPTVEPTVISLGLLVLVFFAIWGLRENTRILPTKATDPLL